MAEEAASHRADEGPGLAGGGSRDDGGSRDERDATSISTTRDSLLTADEEPILEFTGTIEEGEDSSSASFVATEERLLYSLGGGHVRDLAFEHVESVEVGTEIVTEHEGVDPDVLQVLGAFLALVGLGAAAVTGGSGAGLLVGLVLLVAGAAATWYARANYEELADSVAVTEHPEYHVLLRTSATSPFSAPLYLTTRDDAGPQLSRLVREAR